MTWHCNFRAAALLCAGVSVAAWFGLRTRTTDDYVGFYAGGRLAGTGQMHELDAIRQIQRPLMPYIAPFQRLPVFGFLIKPLTYLPVKSGGVLWRLLNLSALTAAILLWPDRNKWTALSFFPCYHVIVIGQDTPFVLLFAATGLKLLSGKQPILAGLALSLCVLKFHLALGLPIFLIAKKQWTAAVAMSMGVLALIAASFAVEGNWIRPYLALMSLGAGDQGAFGMPNFRGIACYFPQSAVPIEIVCSTAAAVLLFYICFTSGFKAGMAAALATGLLVGRHGHLYDCILLLPLLWCAMELKAKAGPLILFSTIPFILPLLSDPLGWLVTIYSIVWITIMCLAHLGNSIGTASAVCSSGSSSGQPPSAPLRNPPGAPR